MRLTRAIGLLCFVTSSVTVEATSSKLFVNSILKDSDSHLEQLKSSHHRSLLLEHNHNQNDDNNSNNRGLLKRRHFSFVSDGDIQKHRKGEEDYETQFACDQSFLQCLPNEKCSNCFGDLYTEQIDWASVTPDTACEEVIDILVAEGHCSYLLNDVEATDFFCKTFTACALWTDDEDANDDFFTGLELEKEGDYGDGTINGTKIDCDALQSCEWPGSHAIFVGDGICHDALPGCYNHKICDYDGGDCCKDTCKDSAYAKCGSDGFHCLNPNSANFNDDTHQVAPAKQEVKALPVCEDNQAIYRLIMSDSFGDGWDGTKITVAPTANSNDIKFNGGLVTGAQGTEYMCLSKESTCYHVSISGGTWGKEVSWEIKPYSEGAPAVASGGSPMECDYSVHGEACEKTCQGKTDVVQAGNDIDYEDFEKMYECINQKCILQVGACSRNTQCAPCMDENIKDYCYGIDEFVKVLDCTMCQCTETKRDDFCMLRQTPGMVIPPVGKEGQHWQDGTHNGNGPHGDGSGRPRHCSSSETIEGSNAVREFSGCSNMEEVGMMVTNFDNNHFGTLDTFESCAHSYAQKEDHGGHTALGCMQILVNSMNANLVDPEAESDHDSIDYEKTPVEAISALSKMLYHNASSFCECASDASQKCPLCRSFMHFKTLLFEVVDACQSLDEIDCAAWDEFAKPCKANIVTKFGDIDFTNQEQCTYVHEQTCGGAGPFPAFRRLDCDDEIPSSSWDFWGQYQKACLGKEVKKDKKVKPTKAPASSNIMNPSTKTRPVPATVNTRPVPVPATSNIRPVPVPATNNIRPVPVPSIPAVPVVKTTPKPYSPPEKKPYTPDKTKPYSSLESSVYVSPEAGSTEDYKPYVPQEQSGKKYTSPEDKRSHWFRNFIILCVLIGGIYLYRQRQSDQFSFVRYRSGGGGGYRAGGESEMYSSLAMDSGSSSFEPPTLPPTPSAI